MLLEYVDIVEVIEQERASFLHEAAENVHN